MILFPKKNGLFSLLPFELIVFIFSFLEDSLTLQQIQKICKYASQKLTVYKFVDKNQFLNYINKII